MEEPHAPMPGAEGLAEPMRSRWSPSIFDAHHRLGAGDIETLLHAAQWAPSWGNRQPWALLVAERGSAGHAVLVRHLSRGNSGWVPRASAVFVTASQVAPDPDGHGGDSPDHACHDLGQAAAHLTLQAQAMGLHAHQFAGFDRAAVHDELGVPAWYRVLTGIAVGVRGEPAEVPERDRDREQKVRRRRELDTFAWGSHWGRPWSGS
ncbi:nitroreductase family protein [Nocardioides sp. cx-173]|uniref:nitroreductase family protein n=1 Tax=Nocardioides sp. cx-173 TaxID=2898796 RepID=UPI001E3CF0CB|nr:nitroreductase family protein [Nocardioides sp. cx-173]MCD4523675.1 nitroreductase family protein [Nocardioides sp. cx-173]UGB41995.1 nitroreductase family protein [Nocardioides sp. cx-173]